MSFGGLFDPLLVHAAATLLMTGLIWFVQVVHYPLMAGVGRSGFEAYERLHTRLTTYVVAPPMLVEAGTAVVLAWKPGDVSALQTRIGLILVVAIWVSTALLQVPQHRILERGFDAQAHRKLVRGNWVRTLAWTARAVLVLSWLG